MISKLITVLILFSFMKNTLQLQHKDIFTIIKEFNLKNPHLIGFMDNKLELIKLLSKNGHFSNIHQRIELLSINENITTNVIVFLESQSKNCYHLEIPKCLFCKFLLILWLAFSVVPSFPGMVTDNCSIAATTLKSWQNNIWGLILHAWHSLL